MAVPRISKEDLKARLESGGTDGPLVLDVRLKYPYEHSTLTLPGALRVDPTAGPDFGSLPRDREIVAYDSDPDELVSAPVVAELVRQGFRAWALKGGIGDWIAANLPTLPKDAPKQAAPAAGSLKG